MRLAGSTPVENEIDNSPNHFIRDTTADLVVIRGSPKLHGTSIIDFDKLAELIVSFQVREIVVRGKHSEEVPGAWIRVPPGAEHPIGGDRPVSDQRRRLALHIQSRGLDGIVRDAARIPWLGCARCFRRRGRRLRHRRSRRRIATSGDQNHHSDHACHPPPRHAATPLVEPIHTLDAANVGSVPRRPHTPTDDCAPPLTSEQGRAVVKKGVRSVPRQDQPQFDGAGSPRNRAST